MSKKVLSLGAIAMDIVLNSHELPKDDGFAFIHHEQMMPGGSASMYQFQQHILEWKFIRLEKLEMITLERHL